MGFQVSQADQFGGYLTVAKISRFIFIQVRGFYQTNYEHKKYQYFISLPIAKLLIAPFL